MLFDLSLAVEMRYASVLVRVRHRAVAEVSYARCLGRVCRRDPVAGLGLHTGLEGGGHDEDGVHALRRLLYRGGLLEVTLGQSRTEALELPGLGRVRPANQRS